MKALSEKQAAQCENATCKRCKCRCHGTLHGKFRNGQDKPTREFFSSLAEDDPHYLPSKESKKDGQK